MSVWIKNGKPITMSWPIRVRDMQKGESAQATLQITDLNGPGRQHFSLTHEVIWKGFGREDLRSCGILSQRNYLRSGAVSFNPLHVVPLAFDLHLCNIYTGEPGHAHANAMYFAGFSKYQEADAGMLSRHLKITEEKAQAWIIQLQEAYGSMDQPSHESASSLMTDLITTLRPQWGANAAELRTVLGVSA